MRGEIFSTRLSCDGRTYFFNVKENRTNDIYITIVESKPSETGNFDRRSIVVFEDNAEAFVKTLEKAIAAIRETVPLSKPPRTRREAEPNKHRDDGRLPSGSIADDERPRHFIPVRRKPTDRAEYPERSAQASQRRPRYGGQTGQPAGEKASSSDRKPIKKTGRVIRVKPKK